MTEIQGIWQKPRKWTGLDDEYFNLTPDYQRIKGNIEYIKSLLEYLNKETFEITSMPMYQESDIPTPNFFNVMVENILTLFNHSFAKGIYPNPMKTYNFNEETPTYKDLNTIENNLFMLYNANAGIVNLQERVGYSTLGIDQFF